MSNESGLAAVHEAAGMISKTEHEKAVSAAFKEGGDQAVTAMQAQIAAARAEGISAGAEAERARLLGIEAHAIPGHEALIASCKADATCTPDMAAGRILAAEKALRQGQMQGIAGVETHTGKVGAAVTTQPGAGATTVAAPKEGEEKSAEAYKADWAKSAELQGEFASADAYANYAAGVASGRIKILASR